MNKRDARLVSQFATEVTNKANYDWWFVGRTSMRLWNLLDSHVPENEMNKALMKKIHFHALGVAQNPDEIHRQEALLGSLQELASRCDDRRISHPFVVRAITEAIQPVKNRTIYTPIP